MRSGKGLLGREHRMCDGEENVTRAHVPGGGDRQGTW